MTTSKGYTREELGMGLSEFSLARRDLNTISHLVDHIRAESSKAYELMRGLKDYNEVYRGNKDVLEVLAMINLNSNDAHEFLIDDKKTLGILEDGDVND